MITTTNKLEKPRVYRLGVVAAGLTVGVAGAIALLVPMDIAWPLALVAPFVGMTILDGLVSKRPKAANAI